MKTRLSLDTEFGFDGDELFELLNKSPKQLAVPSNAMRPKRTEEAAAELQKHLRAHVDQWIASGVQPDGREAPSKRSISRVEEAVYQVTEGKLDRFLRDLYWHRQGIKAVVTMPFDKPRIDLSFEQVDPTNPYAAEIEAGVLLVKLLISDLRFRIAKCRYSECGCYFLLSKRPRKSTYENGTYCSTLHNRAASATRRTKDRRDKCKERQIEWAVAKLLSELRKRRKGWAVWQEQRAIKEALVTAVNDRLASDRNRVRDKIKVNWVTRHQKEIQAKVEEISHFADGR